MRKCLSVVCILAILSMAFVGCSSNETTNNAASSTTQASSTIASSKEDSSATSTTEEIDLVFFTWESTEANNPIWAEIKEELNFNIDVRVLPDTGGADKETALDIVAMSGDVMDFRIIGANAPSVRVEKKLALNLDEYIEKYGIDMKETFGSFSDFVSFNDSYYGIPRNSSLVLWFYNKNIFDAEGIPYPEDGWTWDEYTELAKTLSKGDDDNRQYGTATNAHPMMWAVPALMRGISFVKEDGSSNIRNPEIVNALQTYYDMDAEKIKPSFVSMRSRNSYVSVEFLSGKCAMAQGAPYIIRDMRLPAQFPFDFEAGVVMPPVQTKGDSLSATGFVEFYAINSGSKHPEESFQAIQYAVEKGALFTAKSATPALVNPTKGVVEAFVEGTPISVEDGSKFFDEALTIYSYLPWDSYEKGIDYQAIINEEVELFLTDSQDLEITLSTIETRYGEILEN